MPDLDYLLTGDPDEQITWRGHATKYGGTVKGSRRSIAHLEATNTAARERYGVGLVILQSAYNSTVSASAGTHDKDKVYDVYLPGIDWWAQQRFLREQGWAAWYRYPPSFGHHIHMVSLGGTTPVGIYVPGQVADYYAHRSGLSGHVADSSWHPDDIASTIFDFDAWKDGYDMFSEEDRANLEATRASIDALAAAEKLRAAAEKLRDKEALKAEERRFANIRVILNERLGEDETEKLIGHLKP